MTDDLATAVDAVQKWRDADIDPDVVIQKMKDMWGAQVWRVATHHYIRAIGVVGIASAEFDMRALVAEWSMNAIMRMKATSPRN